MGECPNCRKDSLVLHKNRCGYFLAVCGCGYLKKNVDRSILLREVENDRRERRERDKEGRILQPA